MKQERVKQNFLVVDKLSQFTAEKGKSQSYPQEDECYSNFDYYTEHFHQKTEQEKFISAKAEK